MDDAAQLLMTRPEVVLVAGWGGLGATRAVSWCAVAILLGAGISLAGPASAGGEAFGGLYHADMYAAFAKAVIFAAAAVSILIAPGFFERTSGEDLRPEYPVLILLSAAGMGMMVSAGDLLARDARVARPVQAQRVLQPAELAI